MMTRLIQMTAGMMTWRQCNFHESEAAAFLLAVDTAARMSPAGQASEYSLLMYEASVQTASLAQRIL